MQGATEWVDAKKTEFASWLQKQPPQVEVGLAGAGGAAQGALLLSKDSIKLTNLYRLNFYLLSQVVQSGRLWRHSAPWSRRLHLA